MRWTTRRRRGTSRCTTAVATSRAPRSVSRARFTISGVSTTGYARARERNLRTRPATSTRLSRPTSSIPSLPALSGEEHAHQRVRPREGPRARLRVRQGRRPDEISQGERGHVHGGRHRARVRSSRRRRALQRRWLPVPREVHRRRLFHRRSHRSARGESLRRHQLSVRRALQVRRRRRSVPRRRPRPSRRPRSNDTLTLHVERYPHPAHTPSRYPHASNRAAGAPRSARVARSAT